jgi:beta-galactosidase
VGIDEAGNVQEERILATAGEPAKIRLTADKRRMKADGQDLIYVIAEVVDKQGRVMPIADNRLQFTLQGAGIIEATGSADLKDSEAYSGTSRKVWKGRAMAVVRSTSKKGKITLKVSSPGLSSASVVLTAEK